MYKADSGMLKLLFRCSTHVFFLLLILDISPLWGSVKLKKGSLNILRTILLRTSHHGLKLLLWHSEHHCFKNGSSWKIFRARTLFHRPFVSDIKIGPMHRNVPKIVSNVSRIGFQCSVCHILFHPCCFSNQTLIISNKLASSKLLLSYQVLLSQ